MAFHFQGTVNDWPRAVAKLPAQSCVKAVDRGDILRDSKAVNPGVFTILRHWDDSLQHYDGNTDWAVLVERARHWFSTHIDGTFKDQYAQFTDAVSWHNEIWANSQTAAEQYERVRASEAAVWVWNTEYRPTFANDIKLVIGEAAIGNDMPRDIAALTISSDNLLGYHPYTAWGWDTPKVRWGEDEFDDEPWDTLDWYNLSGRWDVMEHNWGLKPVWAFTEAGPFGNVMNGWKHSDVCGGDRALYVRAVKDWILDVQLTPAYKEGRIVGFNLFTTGGSDKWKLYETAQPELNELADMIAVEWKPGTSPPPPPPPPPPPSDVPYIVVANLLPQNATLDDKWYVLNEVHESKQTILQSADDAARLTKGGRVGSKVTVWNADEWSADIVKWLLDHDAPKVELKIIPGGDFQFEIAVIVDDLPKHATRTYATRPLTDITTLTVHHTVSPPDRSIASIAAYHVDSRGWPGIGYHFVVNDTGAIYQTNWLETISYHAGTSAIPNNNTFSVGIALQGDFTDIVPPMAQLDATRWLIANLEEQLGQLEIKRHRDMPGAATACPGATSPDWIDYVAGL